MRSLNWGWAFVVLALSGCGSGTEPISTLGDPKNTGTLGLALPITTTLTNFTPYGYNGSDGFDLYGNFVIGSSPVKSPGAGLVTLVDVAGQSVTIMHNTFLSSRIKGVTASVVVGNYVQPGAQIGTGISSVIPVHFTVLFNGTAVCPLSYLSSAARTQFLQTIYASYATDPCQN